MATSPTPENFSGVFGIVQTNGTGSRSRWEAISDRALVEALRARQPEAVDEFVRRFEPLVARYARWLRVPSSDQHHWTGEVLYDVAMTLARGRGVMPRHLGAYVAGACRLRALEERASGTAYRARILDALASVHDDVYGSGEAVVVGLSSESALRDARGPEWEPPPLAPVLERLLSAFDEGATPDERRIIKWLGDQISYTRIAEWLGITRPAAVSRIQRLRTRLIEAAFRFGAGLDAAERAELVRFLRRSHLVDQERVAALAQGEHSHKPTTSGPNDNRDKKGHVAPTESHPSAGPSGEDSR